MAAIVTRIDRHVLPAAYNPATAGMYSYPHTIENGAGEFGMVEIPAFVQRIVFPIQVMLGGILGKHKRFANAPPPMR